MEKWKEKVFIIGIIMINGDRYEDDFKNGKKGGKGIYYYAKGNRYEGDFKNDKKEGKGIIYYSIGDREIGEYLKDERIGKHVTLTKYREVIVNNY